MRRHGSQEGRPGVEGELQGAGGGQEEGKRRAGGRQEGFSSTLPVFVFPSQLIFYADQRSSHRRVLTLYNPYNCTLGFKVLCTAPSLYTVVEAEGRVRPKACVDLVVRHQDVSPGNWGRRDRFRLELRGAGGQTGAKEIWAELRGGTEEEEEEEGRVRRRGRTEETRSTQRRQQRALRPLAPLLVPTQPAQLSPSNGRGPSHFLVCVVVGLLCVAVLMLPLHSEPSAMVPRHAHVSSTQKLVSAYILGLLTMVFLR